MLLFFPRSVAQSAINTRVASYNRASCHATSGSMTDSRRPIGSDATIVTGNVLKSRWTCARCRSKKVKCDKSIPCGNCIRAKVECVASLSGRASRKVPNRHARDREVAERLNHLENVTRTLHRQVNASNDQNRILQGDGMNYLEECCDDSVMQSNNISDPQANSQTTPTTTKRSGSVDSGSDRGGIIHNERGTHYVNLCALANLEQELDGLKSSLSGNWGDPLHSEESSPEASQYALTDASFNFGSPFFSYNNFNTHPHPVTVSQLWVLFKSNIDPLVKVLHTPSVERMIMTFNTQAPVSREQEALIFAICYSAVNSVAVEQCLQEFGQPQAVLSAHYRSALEQALGRAKFLESTDITLLQAYLIYLTVLRKDVRVKVIWSLTGVAARIAQMMGLQRDGAKCGLRPFESEIRRRVWWQLCMLDSRAAEEHGCSPLIVETRFNTKMPLNVDDIDLYPDMTELPRPKKGFTDMTICLVMYELTEVFRRTLQMFYDSCQLAAEEMENWVNQNHQRIKETYLTGLDQSIDAHWATYNLTHLFMAKMWLMVFSPLQGGPDCARTIPRGTRRKIFQACIESVEYANSVDTDLKTARWHWLLNMFFQWHSSVFVLSELCRNNPDSLAERAWHSIEEMARIKFGDQQNRVQDILLWRPFKTLLIKARMAREAAIISKLHRTDDGDAPMAPVSGFPAIDTLLIREKSQQAVLAFDQSAGPPDDGEQVAEFDTVIAELLGLANMGNQI